VPVLHLNGYKIANPTVLARLPHDELESLLRGYGHKVHWVEGDDPPEMHEKMATTLDEAIDEIRRSRKRRDAMDSSSGRSGP
jgi:xylulose-5-phosphate/fructose-6-phosphate phosphoketolase